MVYAFWGLLGFLILFILIGTFTPIWRQRRVRKERARALTGHPCRDCGAHPARLYGFRTCRCFGIAPLAAVWETTTREVVACPACARTQAVAACRELGKWGGWGFPGFLVVVVYTAGNVAELVRNRTLRPTALLRCAAWGILLPWTALLLFLAALILLLALILNLSEMLR